MLTRKQKGVENAKLARTFLSAGVNGVLFFSSNAQRSGLGLGLCSCRRTAA